MSQTPYWRRIYETVSGGSAPIGHIMVSEVLVKMKDEISQGLLKYPPFDPATFEEFNRNFQGSSSLKEFIHELSKYLRLESQLSYLVFCNYLMFEYFGKIKEFANASDYGLSVILKEDVYTFYTSERMFWIKTIRQILEYANDTYQRFASQYREFISSLSPTEFQDNLILMFDDLVEELRLDNFDINDSNSATLLSRNLREQIEVALLLILSNQHFQLNTNQLISLTNMFIKINFSSTPVHFETRRMITPEEKMACLSAHVGCFLVCLDQFWEQDNLHQFWTCPNSQNVDYHFKNLRIHDGHDIVMVAWLLLRGKTLGPDNLLIYNSINSEPFRMFKLIITNDIFKNECVSNIFLKACHRLVDEICLIYKDRKHLYEKDGFVKVVTALLRHPATADVCIKTRSGADAVLGLAIESFPYDFHSFTAMVSQLLTHPHLHLQTIFLLNHVPSFLSDLAWTVAKDEIYKLRIAQAAFPDSHIIVFPANTTVKSYNMFGRYLVQYKAKYSYFAYLEYLVSVVFVKASREGRFGGVIDKIVAGFDVVAVIAEHYGVNHVQMMAFDKAIEEFGRIVYQLDTNNLDYRLLKMYLKFHLRLSIARSVEFFNIVPEIIIRIYLVRIKAALTSSPSETLIFANYVFDETIFYVFMQEESNRKTHDMVLDYMKLIFKAVKYRSYIPNFLLSGVLYVLNHVFTKHLRWRYNSELERTRITYKCLKLFHNILQENKAELGEEALQIYQLVRFAFTDNSYVIGTFLKLFVREKYHIHYVLGGEIDWESKCARKKFRCIQMQLALLLLLHQEITPKGQCLLDSKIRTIVKPVLAFFTHAYSPIISTLACRFLDRIAKDRRVRLLALLELDHYQVQTLFLDRLRDPLEEEMVKMTIIELVNTCITNQDGMTAAFFNLKCFLYWDDDRADDFTGDSVCNFMVEYLKNVETSHRYFTNPLQTGILRLIVTLWSNRRENLIRAITSLDNFWPVMMAPFSCEFTQPLEIYVSILRIVNMELSTNSNRRDLFIVICEFLTNRPQLEAWIEYVTMIIDECMSKESAQLASVWMEFIVLSKKFMSDAFDEDCKSKIMLACLNGLNTQPANLSVDVTYILSQFFFILISSWNEHVECAEIVVEKVRIFLKSATKAMTFFPAKVKELIFCNIYKCIKDFAEYFTDNTTVLIAFLEPVGQLIDLEYDNVITNVFSLRDEDELMQGIRPWLIVIFIGNALLDLDIVTQIRTWFDYRKYLSRIMSSVGFMIQTPKLLPFAKIGIDHLIAYAQSHLVEDFIQVDMFLFYYDLRPPTLSLSLDEAILTGIPDNLKEWWWIFTTVIRLNRILIHNLGGVFKETILGFISHNYVALEQIITLTKHTVDTTALALVCETLKMIFKLLDWDDYWKATYGPSYNSTMVGIKATLNACILSVLGAKKINFYNIIQGKTLDIIANPPNELLVSVLNKLIAIIYWSTSCLKKTKPEMSAFLNATKPHDVLTTVVEHDFGVPRFEPPITPVLTYGQLLCLGHYLCKVLNQLSPNTPTAKHRSRGISLTDLNHDVKMKSLAQIFEHCTATYERRIGFMVFMRKTDDLMAADKSSTSFLHYEISDFSGASLVTSQLDYGLVKNALESLMSFLSGEILFSVRKMVPDRRMHYKRELCSEMRFFYEFARKRTVELFNVMTHLPRPLPMLNEATVIQRYMVTRKSERDLLIEGDYMLILCQWLMRVCELTNL